jgi:hypothetical protein
MRELTKYNKKSKHFKRFLVRRYVFGLHIDAYHMSTVCVPNTDILHHFRSIHTSEFLSEFKHQFDFVSIKGHTFVNKQKKGHTKI